jgi:TfoX/Sxy family transcriptional regulator of competence genes
MIGTGTPEGRAIMPTFRKSPPGLVARFGELAALTGDADRKQMFGYPTCVLRGNMFMGLHEDSLILRLAEPDRAEFLSRYDADLFEPMPGRPMKEYVVVPPALVDTSEIDDWVRRSLAYAEQLPAKKSRKR